MCVLDGLWMGGQGVAFGRLAGGGFLGEAMGVARVVSLFLLLAFVGCATVPAEVNGQLLSSQRPFYNPERCGYGLALISVNFTSIIPDVTFTDAHKLCGRLGMALPDVNQQTQRQCAYAMAKKLQDYRLGSISTWVRVTNKGGDEGHFIGRHHHDVRHEIGTRNHKASAFCVAPILDLVAQAHCKPSPCMNGGLCMPMGIGQLPSYKCLCTKLYTGYNCERAPTPGYVGAACIGKVAFYGLLGKLTKGVSVAGLCIRPGMTLPATPLENCTKELLRKISVMHYYGHRRFGTYRQENTENKFLASRQEAYYTTRNLGGVPLISKGVIGPGGGGIENIAVVCEIIPSKN